ncbi:Retinol dehydrogenase 14 [Biomphalaria glabrata]|uniref:Retinol dehydrogenase 14-like n=1 Tax=Biomphalaria glabrata TaxID=6526 RepID=A0A9W2ZYI4_BIOGL|nr:retinol dehydrogenase 14-like [Biomphalaria glabrata]KAI8735302.1 retinol dehydrogenase 14 [Biomphalaria glabrata]
MAWWKTTAFIGFLTVAALRRYLRLTRKCPSKSNINGKTVIITGASSGLGKATAFELARRKAKLILACRNLSSAQTIVKQIQVRTGNSEVVAKELDLSSMSSIHKFCNQILLEEQKIDILINNAGLFQCPLMKTEDGFEMQMGVNHFGHFLLTLRLLDKIKASAPSRIIIVSSSLSKKGHIKFDDINCEQNYNKVKAYSDSKLANLMFARELSERLEGSGVDVIALHPGMVATNLGRYVIPSFINRILSPLFVSLGLRDADEGCQSIVYCAVAEELQKQSGVYIGKDCKPSQYPTNALDKRNSQKLWELSEKLTKIKYNES